MFKTISIAVLAILLAGCTENVEVPTPTELTREAVGHYCNMIIVDHPGPKAQVYEKGRNAPLWFSSVRDAVSYMQSAGEAQNVLAFYVHDMGEATNWEKPQNDGIWIDAIKAFYVIGSTKRGGMGAKETVSFSKQEQASKFATEFGGRVVSYENIPTEYILGDDHSEMHHN